MVPCFPPTYELVKACLPTREEKRKIAQQLGRKDESIVYKWCEDPDGSGRPNPLDILEAILDHARLWHPVAAFAIANRIQMGNARSVGRQGLEIPIPQLVAQLQPDSEKEGLEAIKAFAATMRTLILGGEADLESLLKEVDEAMREFQRAQVMIRAALEAEKREV